MSREQSVSSDEGLTLETSANRHIPQAKNIPYQDSINLCLSNPYISGWIFQKVLAEIVQKGLILSQKALILNRRNFGLLAPKSMRFPSKDSKSKDLSF